MRHLPHSDSSTYWKFYNLVGSLRPYPVGTLAHIVKIYGPPHSATEAQAAFRKRALVELTRRVKLGRADAKQAMQELSLPAIFN